VNISGDFVIEAVFAPADFDLALGLDAADNLRPSGGSKYPK
jgi:hypothetical protein